ncbi:hypothetical protein DL767_011216 [Monosporascus sp. MG133]|nr:hypothetical protein DL767_011216 [Monosporascus sp. MG133]
MTALVDPVHYNDLPSLEEANIARLAPHYADGVATPMDVRSAFRQAALSDLDPPFRLPPPAEENPSRLDAATRPA